MEERQATITDAANSLMTDSATGTSYGYTNPASVTISNGSIVIYVAINTPNKVIRIIKDIKY